MLGQPELRDMLKRPQLVQLSQRITSWYHLGPLTREEVPEYVKYRLSMAGFVRGQLFPPATMRRLIGFSGGVPRLINVICDRALLGVYVQGKEVVDPATLTTAAGEVSGNGTPGNRGHRVFAIIFTGMFLALLASLGLFYFKEKTKETTPLPGLFAQAGNAPSKMPAGVKTALDGAAGNMSKDMAYEALFKQWQAGYEEGTGQSVCDQAQRQGLQCLSGRENMNNLIQMNRPAVLRFIDEKGGEYYGAILSLRDGEASVALADKRRTVGAKEIAQWWTGEYFLLWRAPQGFTGRLLRPGERGPLASWVKEQLSLIEGGSAPVKTDDFYGRETAKRVKRIQSAAGLISDGIVGPKTIIHLSDAVDNGDPLLNAARGGD